MDWWLLLVLQQLESQTKIRSQVPRFNYSAQFTRWHLLQTLMGLQKKRSWSPTNMAWYVSYNLSCLEHTLPEFSFCLFIAVSVNRWHVSQSHMYKKYQYTQFVNNLEKKWPFEEECFVQKGEDNPYALWSKVFVKNDFKMTIRKET